MQNLVAVSHATCVHVERPPKIAGRSGPTLGMGAWLTHRKTALPTCVTVPNLVVIRAYVRRSAEKNGRHASRLSRSLKVIGTDTDRSATYDFL